FFVASIPQAFPKKYAKMIRRVPPGTVWTSDGQSKRFFCHATRDGILDDLLSESVRRQIPKEVSWGCLLSGGVDSSTIAALACREYGKINTFTSGLAGSEDLIAASKVAEHLGTNHHEEIINPTELPKLLKDVIGVSGSPDPYVAMSGLGTYVAARGAARFGAKVLLSGEGADELFAGYDEYLSEPEYSLNARLTHDQNDLGATECLRLDRCTMAYSIEARVPFLSPSMVRHARTIPIQWKLCHHNGNIIRKPVLRRFAKRLLPKWVADRPKNPFFRGAGIFSSLSSIANDLFSMKKVKCMKSEFPEFPIEDPISAWVFSIWYEQYAYLSDNINDLINRGLFRRRFSQYQPHCEEPTQYSSPMYSERFKY
ncbi:MAG: asparagine synthase C-terminal domain-containing protein, partial [Desulfobacterales bacterium]|nr:asparagine synthase C-terminal domain-containing protein [Desulfobacterales bacterium]